MAEMTFRKSPTGLIPDGDEAREWLARKKLGCTILVEPRELRNGAFHRKWFALVKLAYDYWSESAETIEYKGHQVAPDFERFRKDVTILCGHYHPVVGIKGELRIEPDSLRWASMDEITFGKLYDRTITVLLARVFNGKVCPTWTEEQLRSVAEQILEFAA
jgi:hypothetical protein